LILPFGNAADDKLGVEVMNRPAVLANVTRQVVALRNQQADRLAALAAEFHWNPLGRCLIIRQVYMIRVEKEVWRRRHRPGVAATLAWNCGARDEVVPCGGGELEIAYRPWFAIWLECGTMMSLEQRRLRNAQ
jgi:hypothetical protein